MEIKNKLKKMNEFSLKLGKENEKNTLKKYLD